jgi:hypothetical protein
MLVAGACTPAKEAVGHTNKSCLHCWAAFVITGVAFTFRLQDETI